MKFQWPIDKPYRWISGYDYSSTHYAQDFGTVQGANYYAPQSGVITTARFTLAPNITGQEYGYGNYIVIDHGNGWHTLGAHLLEGYVKVGDTVIIGQLIAKCDNTGWSTGPHLHFSIDQNGTHYKPTDILYDSVEPVEPPDPPAPFVVPQEYLDNVPLKVNLTTTMQLRIRSKPAITGSTVGYLPAGLKDLQVFHLIPNGNDYWMEIGYKQFAAGVYAGDVWLEFV